MVRAFTLLVSVLVAGSLIAPAAAAATPSSGSVSPSSPSVSWTGPARTANTAGPSDAECTAPAAPPLPGGFCDDFSLSVSVPAGFWDTHAGGVQVDLTGVPPAEDFDVHVYDRTGREVASSSLPGSVESALIPCADDAGSPYEVRVVYFTTVDEGAGLPGYQASATFTSQAGTCAGEGTGAPPTWIRDALSFAPATVTSAEWLGGEPQVTIERREPYSSAAAGIDPNRVFVDWPVSSRSGIGQLQRSLDGGDSFRLLFDRTCASRSRPNCLTEGGGDTENEVNLANGQAFFADQEILANEALASSTDHGDSWTVQTAVTNFTTATDRQWVGVTDNTTTVAGRTIVGFLVYHVPPQGYVQAIDASGLPLPQPAPQLQNVGQSGQIRVDNNAASPGHGWIYWPHTGVTPGGTLIATASSAAYTLPTDWGDTVVTGASSTTFPWIAIDAAGNAYMTWDTGGVVYYSSSNIHDKANDPSQGGRPGTLWSPKTRVSLPEVGSAVFAEVTAGDAGRIGIAYVGTTDWTGEPDDAPDSAAWNTYAAVIPNALATSPTVQTGVVTHRVMHYGNICTSGTTCATTGKDRSLLDMIDVSFDEAGRLGVVTMDNNSDAFHAAPPGGEDESPFVHFAKQTSGPSVLAGTTIDVTIPTGGRSDAAGDATWPNVAGAANLPSLDELSASLSLEGGDVVARIDLADARLTSMQRDLTAYNGVLCAPATACLADRFEYTLRFLGPRDIYHLSAEFTPGAPLRFFGGKLDANDKLTLAASPTATYGAGYHTDFAASGSVSGNTLIIRAPLSAFGLTSGVGVESATAFAMAGPSEATELTVDRLMRTVDATPPFDTVLTDATDLSIAMTDAPDPVRVKGTLTYSIVVRNLGSLGATGVMVSDQLPKLAGFSSVATTAGTCLNKAPKGVVTCTIGSLPAGSQATITIVVKPTGPGVIVNGASVTSTTPDPNAANNTATATTTVTK